MHDATRRRIPVDHLDVTPAADGTHQVGPVQDAPVGDGCKGIRELQRGHREAVPEGHVDVGHRRPPLPGIEQTRTLAGQIDPCGASEPKART